MNRKFSFTNCLTALRSSRRATFCLALLLAGIFALTTAQAQLAGKGAVSGTILDPTGASVPNATVVMTNDANGVATTTTSTGSGDYAVSTLDAGVYTITVSATGFQKLVQKNVQVNALETQSFSPKLTLGASSEEVTVSTLPPQLETSNATLGATMENEMYAALPIEMGAYGQPDQRRATDFAFLMPGVQGNNTSGNATTNTGIVNGSGSKGGVSVVYVDGVAFVRAGGNGDPRYVWTAISVDAVDQFQLQTSGYSAIYEGQGIQNYTIKEGGSKFHGSVYEFFRNTVLDTWGWNKGKTKPIENSNEYGINLSGPLVPFGKWKDKLFFFGNYNGFRYASETPMTISFPTVAEQNGNFSNDGGFAIYDPNTQTACTAHSSDGPCRYQYGFQGSGTTGSRGNPIPIPGAVANVIPQSEFWQPAVHMQSYIPNSDVNQSSPQSNYIAPNKTGLVNWSTTDRIDYIIGPKDTLTMVAAIGRQASSNPVGQATPGRNVGPEPYNYSQAYAPKTAVGIIEETHTFTDHLVNQFKYGYARYNGPTFDPGNAPAFSATTQGLSNLPAGPAQTAFPIVAFSSSINSPTNNSPFWWAGTTPNSTIAENYTLVDNVQWTKGAHTLTFGAQLAWLLYNVNNATGGSTPLTLSNSITETAGLAATPTGQPATYATASGTGQSYASFLIGQVDKASLTQYVQQEFGARFRPISPYVQDNWKITSKLTADIGIRWDYFPALREVHDAESFFSPTIANPATGNPGGLEFTGNGAGTCNCDTPVHQWYKNFGPRIGIAYQSDPKTVWRASYGVMFTHGNGVGGGTTSLGTLGFSAAPTESASGTLLSTTQFAGTNGAFLPFTPAAGVGSGPQYGSGYSTLAFNGSTASGTPQSIGYIDPYLGSRAPEYINWTFGFQHQWTSNFTSTITYVGSQGHFLAPDGTNARGFFADQLDPKYLALGSKLSSSATAVNCTSAGVTCPTNFLTTRQVSDALKPFPFQTVGDTFGNVGNSNYNALQASFNMRPTHGFTFMANYTWSRSIDDNGTFRTGYAIPAGFVANEPSKAWSQDRIERSVSTSNQPQHVVITGVWDLPFGKSIANSNSVERAILGGFHFSEIFQAFSGSPAAITASSCQTNPAQTCNEPNLNPSYIGQIRQNGAYGKKTLSGNPTTVSYIVPSAGTATAPTGPFISTSFVTSSPFSPNYTFANAPRTAAYNLYGPGNYQLDLALVRTFPLHFYNSSLNFRAEMYNVTNKTFFAFASTQLGNSSFGTMTTSPNYNRRAAQFSARLSF